MCLKMIGLKIDEAWRYSGVGLSVLCLYLYQVFVLKKWVFC
jgi:hypothetical protein